MSKERNFKKGLPKDYFKHFQNNLNNRIDRLEDDLEKDAEILYSLKGKKEYSIPKNYFENFKVPVTTNKRSYTRTIKLFSSVAAAFALLVVSFQLIPKAENELALNNIEDEVLYEYLLENVSELDDETLYSLDFDFASEELTAEEEIEYLLENTYDFELSDF